MKLALLGVDETAKLAAISVAAGDQHEISIVCAASDEAAEILQSNPAAKLEPEWESLLLGRDFDLLLVAASQEPSALRDEQLRRLVQESVPTVVVQPAAEAILLHELAMIQHDTKSILAAWNPVLGHPAWQQIGQSLPDVAAGEISQVSFYRSLSDAKWPQVMWQIGRDAQWIRQLIGPPDRVTALAPELREDELQNLVVTFVGRTAAMAQWSLARGASDDIIKIETPTGSAVWKPACDGSCVIAIESKESPAEIQMSAADCERAQGQNLIKFLEDALAGRNVDLSFEDATRAVELAEAAHECNRRSRTIHLHYEQHNEQQTFKSMMAAGGCLLLLGVLVVLGASIMIDSIGAPVRNNPWWRIWPVYLLSPIVLFLLAQTLWRVFATPKS